MKRPSKGKYIHFRIVNLEPGQPNYILCVHAPETEDVQLTSLHDFVTCPNCMDENIQTAVSMYNSLVNIR